MNRKPTYEELEKKIRHLERILQEETEKTAKFKSVILSNIHHEIRTPMNIIMGYSNLLATRNVSASKKNQFAEYIKKGNTKLMTFIDDLIDASLLELGSLQLEEKECYVNKLFNNLYNYFNKQRRLNRNYPLSLLLNKEIRFHDFIIIADGQRLYQAIFKIIHTAFECNTEGVIEFGYTLDEKYFYFFLNDSRNFFLNDTNPNYLTIQEFDEIKTRKTDHFDLGITIAEKIIKQMAGKIWVERNILGGYSIKFNMPVKIPGIGRELFSISENKIYVA